MMESATLLEKFVTGEAALLTSQDLQLAPVGKGRQLSTLQGKLVAIAQQKQGGQDVLIKQESPYRGQLHTLLLQHHYLPLDTSPRSGFDHYEYRPLPHGYKVNHTEARVLWRAWWMGLRHGDHPLQMDLLIYVRKNWYPIRQISCRDGSLLIKTLLDEIHINATSPIIWLSKTQQTAYTSPYDLQNIPEEMPKQSRPVDLPPQVRVTPTAPSPLPDLNLAQVLRFHQGQLLIQTALGEVVVEGSDFRFWLKPS